MRNISGNTFADEFFGGLSHIHRLLWLGLLLNVADDQGRMIDNVALMRSLIFPYDMTVTVKDIEKGLTIFAAKHKITRYVVGTNGSGKRLIQVVNWWKFQRSAQWAGRSLFPAPPKWLDRIRAHETGGGITLMNWDQAGGYEPATKQVRRKSEPATKPVQSREVNNEVNNEVNTVVVVVADALKKYDQEICKLTDHTKRELEKLYKLSPTNLVKAIDVTIEQGHKKFAYVKGVFENIQKGTVKPEPASPRRTRQPATPNIDSGRFVKL